LFCIEYKPGVIAGLFIPRNEAISKMLPVTNRTFAARHCYAISQQKKAAEM